MQPDLDLAAARALVVRAVDKAEQLGIAGAIVVVGASGALITGSRMDEGGAGGFGRARSKAWIAATQKIPSTEHLHRMTSIAPPVAVGFAAVSPEAMFPGAGGMPIRRDGRIVGGIAASGSTVSPFFPAGMAPELTIVEGQPANPEDQVIAYALGQPYVGQHGDDLPRWVKAYGDFPATPPDAVVVPEAAADQADLDHGRRLADAVLAAGLPVSVVVVDRRGEVVHIAVSDTAPTASPYLAEGVAAAAALFDRPSSEVADLAAAAGHVLPVAVVALAGGLPLPGGGAVGVAGVDPAECERLAAGVIG